MAWFGQEGENPYLGGYTGRSLVLFAEDGFDQGAEAIRSATGVTLASIRDDGDALASADAVLFEELGVAVVNAPPGNVQQAAVDERGARAILAVEPERMVYALEIPPGSPSPPPGVPEPPPAPLPWAALAPVTVRSADYLQGFRDAVLCLTGPAPAPAAPYAAPPDESQATWGLQAVKAVSSSRSGRGVRVAVLDTGFDLKHPDFAGRKITAQSFVAGEDVQDAHGHGTHCIGTAAGPKLVATGPRYGVAYEAEIFAGKVLGNQGSGSDAQILAGMNWAVTNGCAVVSMSLGAPTQRGQKYSPVFEQAARRASAAGTLIVAAAGNDSRRPGVINPVSHPANCPSILAVAAVDASMGIASFSNRGINPDGGQVDVAGPGVDILSSWPMPTRYRRISGTSMATPHAAGVAALLAEATPNARGAALGTLLMGRARRLANLSSADVGAGLVQAP